MNSLQKLKIGWLIAGVIFLGIFLVLQIDLINSQRSISSQKATGLGAVANGSILGQLGLVRFEMPRRSMFMNASMNYLEPEQREQAEAAKKIVRRAELYLLVADVPQSVANLRQRTQELNGDVEKAAIKDAASGGEDSELLVRVPAERLDTALERYKEVAVRVQSEKVETEDITRQWIDIEARLRNMSAEEQQYLAILKRAANVQDTLEVTGKLSELRGKIESAQAELKLMSRQVAMSSVHIYIEQEAKARVFGVRWRPLYNAKIAFGEMVGGIANWVDWLVAAFLKLPLILVWFATIVLLAGIAWRVLKATWRRVFPGVPVSVPRSEEDSV